MTTISYDLALALKTAGWIQPRYDPDKAPYIDGVRFEGGYTYPGDPADTYELAAYAPSLSDLIAACPDQFDNRIGCLFRLHAQGGNDGWWASYREQEWLPTPPEGRGATPEEAVAKLWLKLQSK